MFGLDKIAKATLHTVDKAVSDPVGFAVDTVTQPIVDTIDVLGGLSEGELRTHAATRLAFSESELSNMVTDQIVALLLEAESC